MAPIERPFVAGLEEAPRAPRRVCRLLGATVEARHVIVTEASALEQRLLGGSSITKEAR